MTTKASKLFFVFLTLLLLAPSSAFAGSSWSNSKEAALQALASRLTGTVVYQRSGKIYANQIGDLTPQLISASGSYPRWSPDGTKIAFFCARKVCLYSTADHTTEFLASASAPLALAWAPTGEEIYFSNDKSVKAVTIANHSVRTVFSGSKFKELAVSPDGKRLLATVYGHGGFWVRDYNLETRTVRALALGCAPSFSPTGQFVGYNKKGHSTYNIANYPSGRVAMQLRAPAKRNFDNQYWSNSQHYIASITEKQGQDILIHDLVSGQAIQVTATGGCNRPDLFVDSEQ